MPGTILGLLGYVGEFTIRGISLKQLPVKGRARKEHCTVGVVAGAERATRPSLGLGGAQVGGQTRPAPVIKLASSRGAWVVQSG